MFRKRLKEAQEIDRLVNDSTPDLHKHEIKPSKKKKAQDTVEGDDLEKMVDDHLQAGGGKKKKKKKAKDSGSNTTKNYLKPTDSVRYYIYLHIRGVSNVITDCLSPWWTHILSFPET